LSEGKNFGNFMLLIGLMLVGVSIVYTGIQYMFSKTGAPAYVFLVVVAVGIALFITGAVLARHYL
jgi:hypothetical protein